MACMSDLCIDVLSNIMLMLALSTDGATHIANIMVVCKTFMEATKNSKVLEAACFKNVTILNRYSLFQKRNGILCECAAAGNETAQYLVGQMILASTTHLTRIHITCDKLHHFRDHTPKYRSRRVKVRDDSSVASFMAHFVPGRGSSNAEPHLLHWELVKVFLIHCSISDLCDMYWHLRCYVSYFSRHLTSTELEDEGVYLRHLYNETHRGFFIDVIHAMHLIGLKDGNSHLIRVEGNYYIIFTNGTTYPSLRSAVHPHIVVEWLDWVHDKTAFEDIRVQALVVFDALINSFSDL